MSSAAAARNVTGGPPLSEKFRTQTDPKGILRNMQVFLTGRLGLFGISN
jgi:hypothetical protein